MELESSFSSGNSDKKKRPAPEFVPLPIARPEAPAPFRPPILAEISPSKPVESKEDDDDEEPEEDRAEAKGAEKTPVNKEESAEGAEESPVPAAEFTEFSGPENTIYSARPAPESLAPEESVPAEIRDDFEAIMKDMGPEFTEAVSGAGLTELMSEEEPKSPGAPSGGSIPPPPPKFPTFESGFGSEPMPEPIMPPMRSWEAPLSPVGTLTAEQPARETKLSTLLSPQLNFERQARNREESAEKRGLRKGLIAGFITAYVIKGYIDGKKREREAKRVQKEFARKDEQISGLQMEQQRLRNERERMQAETMRAAAERTPVVNRQETVIASRPAEALPPVKTAEQLEDQDIYDLQGNRITLQPGWRVEKSPAGYSVVKNEKGQVEIAAITYGEGFRRDAREKLKADSVAAAASGVLAGSAAVGASSGTMSLPEPMLSSGHTDLKHVLPSGLPPKPDINHRLPKPKNQIASTVTNPWLWTAIAILLIIYFLAALS